MQISAHKSCFNSTSNISLQFRAEAFNVINKTIYNAPAVTTNAATFGRITSAMAKRQIQFAFRLTY